MGGHQNPNDATFEKGTENCFGDDVAPEHWIHDIVDRFAGETLLQQIPVAEFAARFQTLFDGGGDRRPFGDGL